MTAREYRRLRVRVGSQAAVARKLKGLHPQTISKRERGELEIDGEAECAIRYLALRSGFSDARVQR